MGNIRSIKDIKEERMEKKRKARRRRRTWFLLSEIFVLLILLGIGYIMFKYDRFQLHSFGIGDLKINEGVVREGYTTYALFGGDSRSGVLEAGTHSDSIMVVSIHNKTKEVRMVSIYRDTLTEQMSGSLHKANNAYFVGGPTEAINMLNKNFDLNIQGYAMVDFTALADVIDLLGGIEVDVEAAEAAEMNRYINETATVVGKSATLVSAGNQTLDGVQAVTYARIRKSVGGDFKRADRQREVIGKILTKVKQADIMTLNKIINQVFSKVSTSFSLQELMTLATGATRYEVKDSKGFPFEYANGRVDGAGSVVVPLGLADNVQELHAFLYQDDEYQPSDTVLGISTTIENATGLTRADVTPAD